MTTQNKEAGSVRRIILSFIAFFLVTGLLPPVSHAGSRDILSVLRDKGVLSEQEIMEIKGAQKKDSMSMHWSHGIRFGTADKAFKFKLGGRVYNDWSFKSEGRAIKSALGEQSDTTEFRTARLYIAGLIYENVIFKGQYDFAGGDVDWKDVYIGLKEVPFLGKVLVGHFKEPFGLEELTSSKYVTYIERGLSSAFVPSRNTGIGFSNHGLDKRVTWAAGFFTDAGAYGNENGIDNNFHATARITALPWYQDKDKLMHLGFDYSYREATDNATSIKSMPEIHTGSEFVDTGTIGANSENRFGAEAAVVYGPFSLQGEFLGSDIDTHTGQNPFLYGYYGSVSWFLTGDHRNYSSKKGHFSRTKPRANFGRNGIGAWELAVRYSGIDLTDKAISGGKMKDVTVGLNWYLNPNSRVMFNYVHSDLNNVGNSNFYQTRIQIDF